MKVVKTNLEGCYIIHNTVFGDDRGYFFESFHQKLFQELTGISPHFVQDNQSKSARGVLRGLHLQKAEFAQAKLVRVLKGEVLDVVVDVRKNSKTFGKHLSIILSSTNNTQLFIPKGFAHGFVVLSETATFFYKCDAYYNKDSEAGIIYNDTELAIDWKLNSSEIILSEKDKNLPSFAEFKKSIA